MQTLALLHRWAGGIVGLLLAILGLSGAILVWEESWIGVPHAQDAFQSDVHTLARSIGAASGEPGTLSRITFADESFGLHQAVYADGSGAYLNQSGKVVERWSSQWERPELWLFDLHHYLFIGDAGETLAGVAGLVGLFFVVSGAILWWRTRSTFKFRLWPARMSRSAITRQHRDLGVVAAPLLLLTMLTGVLMIFGGLSQVLLAPWSAAARDQPAPVASRQLDPRMDWARALRAAQDRFPGADFRRLQIPRKSGAPLLLRMRQPSEWTPNGRSYVYLDPAAPRVLGVEDPLLGSTAAAVEEKYYPIHSAKVGGWVWKAFVCLTGVALALLGSLAVYGFWFRPVLR